ncbi:MAG: hypothetical protein HKP17_06455 [Ignavibacteriaceae bacterium]|nr:hypothetical protein [Ignavibacteriaceae bacterium]
MRNFIKLSFTMLLALLLFTGCSNEDNPLDSTDPGNGGNQVIIKTPKYMELTKIILTRFPVNKSNGDKWDYHVFPSSPTRRPDIYVDLSKSGSSSHVFRSDIREDAIFETAYDNFVFTKPVSSNDGSLPYSVPVNQTYKIDVWDDDGLTADDWMGSVSVNAAGYYNDDNATNIYKTLKSCEITIRIEGRWIY